MEMTNNDLIPFYALVCGKHIHKTVLIDNQDGYEGDTICPDCRKVWIGNVEVEQFNPYVTYEDTTELTLEVRKVIEKQWPKMWKRYVNMHFWHGTYTGLVFEELSAYLNPQGLYYYMKNHPEDWAWVECPACAGTKTKHNYPYLCCPACLDEDYKSTGNIPHPAWTWIKERERNIEKY